MVKFTLKEKEYELNDFLTLNQYSKIYKIKDLFNDQYFAAKLINLMTDCPIEDLLKCDYEEINYISTYILSLLPLDNNQPFVDRFEIDGVHYGFFPNWQDLTFAEYIDMDTISTKSAEELLDMIHILAAIMYRPIDYEISKHNFLIEEYDVKTMVPRSEIFKNKLDIKILFGAQVFFCKFVKRYFLYTQASLIPKMSIWKKIKLLWKTRKWMKLLTSKKVTGGSSSSIELLQMILANTKQSTKKV